MSAGLIVGTVLFGYAAPIPLYVYSKGRFNWKEENFPTLSNKQVFAWPVIFPICCFIGACEALSKFPNLIAWLEKLGHVHRANAIDRRRSIR